MSLRALARRSTSTSEKEDGPCKESHCDQDHERRFGTTSARGSDDQLSQDGDAQPGSDEPRDQAHCAHINQSFLMALLNETLRPEGLRLVVHVDRITELLSENTRTLLP